MYARPSNKSLRDQLKEVERGGWTITGGGNRHYQLWCPNPCQCRLTLSASPSNINEAKLMRRHLINRTCWEPTNDNRTRSPRKRPVSTD